MVKQPLIPSQKRNNSHIFIKKKKPIFKFSQICETDWFLFFVLRYIVLFVRKAMLFYLALVLTEKKNREEEFHGKSKRKSNLK